MTRRGDGIGIEVLPESLRGVRIQQDIPGRVAKVATIACDTSNDLSLLDGLTRLRGVLDEAGEPTRVAMWTADGSIQSLDVTGWSTTELNQHRSRLDDISATIEVSAGPRRLLTHLRWDMIRNRRVERLVRQAGFDLEAIEPTPVAVSRLVPPYTMRLVGGRGEAQPWVAVVHDRAVVAAAPLAGDSGVSSHRHDELQGASWSMPVDDFRERLLEPRELQRAINQPSGEMFPFGLSLVGDGYPEFPDTHPAWGPRLAGALGAAVAAGGLAGRIQQVQPLVAPHAYSDDGGVWVIQRVGDVEPPPAQPAQHSRWRKSRAALR
jgi:hypothetical protein